MFNKVKKRYFINNQWKKLLRRQLLFFFFIWNIFPLGFMINLYTFFISAYRNTSSLQQPASNARVPGHIVVPRRLSYQQLRTSKLQTLATPWWDFRPIDRGSNRGCWEETHRQQRKKIERETRFGKRSVLCIFLYCHDLRISRFQAWARVSLSCFICQFRCPPGSSVARSGLSQWTLAYV